MRPASAKAKAREHEHRTARLWTDAGFPSEREGKQAPSLDVLGPIPIECKKRFQLSLPSAVRKMEGVHGEGSWVLHYEYGDRRESDAPGNVMVMPEWFGMELIKLWREHDRQGSGAGDRQPAR